MHLEVPSSSQACLIRGCQLHMLQSRNKQLVALLELVVGTDYCVVDPTIASHDFVHKRTIGLIQSTLAAIKAEGETL